MKIVVFCCSVYKSSCLVVHSFTHVSAKYVIFHVKLPVLDANFSQRYFGRFVRFLHQSTYNHQKFNGPIFGLTGKITNRGNPDGILPVFHKHVGR